MLSEVWKKLTKKHANMGFNYGLSLPDSGGLPEGTGKNMRHIKFRQPGELKKSEITDLIESALSGRIKFIYD